jgi:hypothetical protein
MVFDVDLEKEEVEVFVEALRERVIWRERVGSEGWTTRMNAAGMDPGRETVVRREGSLE